MNQKNSSVKGFLPTFFHRTKTKSVPPKLTPKSQPVSNNVIPLSRLTQRIELFQEQLYDLRAKRQQLKIRRFQGELPEKVKQLSGRLNGQTEENKSLQEKIQKYRLLQEKFVLENAIINLNINTNLKKTKTNPNIGTDTDTDTETEKETETETDLETETGTDTSTDTKNDQKLQFQIKTEELTPKRIKIKKQKKSYKTSKSVDKIERTKKESFQKKPNRALTKTNKNFQTQPNLNDKTEMLLSEKKTKNKNKNFQNNSQDYIELKCGSGTALNIEKTDSSNCLETNNTKMGKNTKKLSINTQLHPTFSNDGAQNKKSPRSNSAPEKIEIIHFYNQKKHNRLIPNSKNNSKTDLTNKKEILEILKKKLTKYEQQSSLNKTLRKNSRILRIELKKTLGQEKKEYEKFTQSSEGKKQLFEYSNKKEELQCIIKRIKKLKFDIGHLSKIQTDFLRIKERLRQIQIKSLTQQTEKKSLKLEIKTLKELKQQKIDENNQDIKIDNEIKIENNQETDNKNVNKKQNNSGDEDDDEDEWTQIVPIGIRKNNKTGLQKKEKMTIVKITENEKITRKGNVTFTLKKNVRSKTTPKPKETDLDLTTDLDYLTIDSHQLQQKKSHSNSKSNQIIKSKLKTKKISQRKRALSICITKKELNKTQFEISSLTKLLTIPTGVAFFQEYLCTEFNQENIMFWQEVKSFKQNCVTQRQIRKIAKKIILKFIKPESLFEINIDSECRTKILKQFKQKDFSNEMFDQAHQIVFNHLQLNSFDNFKYSKYYPILIKYLRQDSTIDLQPGKKICALVFGKKNIIKKKSLNDEKRIIGKTRNAYQLGEELLTNILDISSY
ncbi:regulator of g-protein signaling 13 [Anaeramoeba flamelloides]|uniref:Regulator of g-protein signaling 13 n=1 Tax=Anaeramoeba flamelloides TaxID=1746091 RepID=A0ABQ8XS56_9EUKA|nr:regulator of g-protein signaling 13 [Anaeramoeba flamelloides]